MVLLTDEWVILLIDDITGGGRLAGWQAGRKSRLPDIIVATATIYASTTTTTCIITTKAMHACDGGLQPAYAAAAM